MRKVTEPEIEKLYAFTRKHYVEYYDLQTELVDHLANGMEVRWKENPQLNFEENLQMEFKKFGVFGFSEVVDKRRAAMQKKYLRLIGKESLLTIRSPKVLFFGLLLIGICTFLMRSETGFIILYWGIVALTLVELIVIFKTHFSNQKKRKKRAKNYLLEEMISNIGEMHIFFLFPLNLLGILNSIEIWKSSILSLLFALFLAVVVLLAYVAFSVLPKKKEEILAKAYPERELLP